MLPFPYNFGMALARFIALLVLACAWCLPARAQPLPAVNLQYVGPSTFTVNVGGTVSTMKLKATDVNGNPVAGAQVGFGGNWCPLYYDQPTFATSDASGIITLPAWNAPGYVATCFIWVTISNSGVYQASFTINVLPGPSDAPATASLAYFGTTLPGYHVDRGNQLFLRLALLTLDGSGRPVPRQHLAVTSSCGAFAIPPATTPSTSTLDMMSDASGVATLPAWFAPNADASCEIDVRYSSSVSLKFTMAVGNGPAPMVATGLTPFETPDTIRVAAGGYYDGIRVKTINSAGEGVGNQFLYAGTRYGAADCGTLGGVEGLNLRSDASGIAELPRFNAPATAKTCRIGVNLVSGAGQIFFTIEIFTPPPPPPAPPAPPAPTTPPVTTATGTSPAGGTITLSLASVSPSCSLTQTDFVDPATISPSLVPPSGLVAPHGYLQFTMRDCGTGQPVTFNVDFAQDLPPTAQLWKLGPTPDNRANHWYAIPATVSGKRISFTITDGGMGDDDLAMNGSIRFLAMPVIPGGLMQDLWWSGPGENGWGMSIVQHRDVLFANIFTYDGAGNPTWYVMPSGSWNADHTVYTGNLYLPKGSPFYAYDGTKFDIGASVGTMRLTFAGPNNASFDYTINGVVGHKDITRVLFGPQDAPTDKPLGDLWWAGSQQNGWGLAILQQYSTLFALWFTYDANGKATWLVMPGGSWAANGDYRGPVYRAAGSPWLGVPYDASRHQLTQVGTFRFVVTGDGASFEYTVDGRSGTIPLSRIPF